MRAKKIFIPPFGLLHFTAKSDPNKCEVKIQYTIITEDDKGCCSCQEHSQITVQLSMLHFKPEVISTLLDLQLYRLFK